MTRPDLLQKSAREIEFAARTSSSDRLLCAFIMFNQAVNILPTSWIEVADDPQNALQAPTHKMCYVLYHI